MGTTAALSTGDQPFPFAPDWGAEDWRLWKLVAAASAGELPDTIEEMLRDISANLEGDRVKVAYSIALLADILKAGGRAWVRDSQLYVAWPDWNGPKGRRSAHAAMSAAREMRDLTLEEIRRVRPMFAPEIDGEQLAAVLRSAEFTLQSAASSHESGIGYQEAFGAALRYWTMPYRGRTGRMKRFVLTAKHPHLGPAPVVAGLLELGDEAPFCSWRDELLGLNGKAFVEWFRNEPLSTRSEIAERLKAIRACLRPTSSGWDLSAPDAADVLAKRSEIDKAAHGRSLVLDRQHDILKDRKRLAYGLRLARGECALRQIAGDGEARLDNQDLMAGIRAVHDLVLPRTHLEATVCGAVPPFSDALGGKLVVAFMSHPNVVSSTMGAESELVGWSFDRERLEPLLPSHGMLCITTKGLYANHAAIYTKCDMPGLDSALRLKHLANTSGITTSLVSDRTTRLARLLIEAPGDDRARVSSVYGSGGAKRHRAIDAATLKTGLPPRLAFAGIRRPVYGLRFVKNPEAVCWLNASPHWTIDRNEDPGNFERRATELWRKRWLERGIDRIQDYAVAPSLLTMLEAGTRVREAEPEVEIA